VQWLEQVSVLWHGEKGILAFEWKGLAWPALGDLGIHFCLLLSAFLHCNVSFRNDFTFRVMSLDLYVSIKIIDISYSVCFSDVQSETSSSIDSSS